MTNNWVDIDNSSLVSWSSVPTPLRTTRRASLTSTPPGSAHDDTGGRKAGAQMIVVDPRQTRTARCQPVINTDANDGVTSTGTSASVPARTSRSSTAC